MDLLTSALLLSSFVGTSDAVQTSQFTEVPGNRYVINNLIPLNWLGKGNIVTEDQKREESEKDEAKKDEVKKDKAKKAKEKKSKSKKANKKKGTPKSTKANPAETKPAETKPAETKPAETKPAETKPAETKPAETKPAETKPAETKPAETKPAETKPAETKKEEAKPKYETIDVKAKKLHVIETFPACVVPKNVYPISLDITEVDSSFRVLSVKPYGTKVSKGDQLIELDLEAYDRTLADMRQNVKALELSFQRAQAAIETARKTNELDLLETKQSIERAKDNFEYFWKVEWPAKLASVEFSAKVAKMKLDAQIEEFEQLKKMYEADDLVEHEEEFLLKRAKLDLDVAQFNYKLSVEAYNHAKTVEIPNTEQDNKQKYERLESLWKERLAVAPLAIKEAELEFESQKIVLERAKIKLERMEAQRSILECKAPCDGIFLYGTFDDNQYSGFDAVRSILKPNGTVPRKKTIAVVVSGDLSLSVTIPEPLLSSMENGLKGWFTLNAYPDSEMAVTLNSFSEFPVAEEEYQGVAHLCNDVPATIKFVPGMKGKVELVLKDKAKTIMLPLSAVGRDGTSTQRYVYVLKGDKTVKRAVKTGYSNDKEIEIIDSLESGEKVVKDYSKVEDEE